MLAARIAEIRDEHSCETPSGRLSSGLPALSQATWIFWAQGRRTRASFSRRPTAYDWTAEKLEELYGSVLAENTTMLKMVRELGFRIEPEPGDAAVRHVVPKTQ
jgi:hypothetical protein